jgi:hypothetical protein
LRDHFQFIAERDANAFGAVVESENSHKCLTTDEGLRELREFSRIILC